MHLRVRRDGSLCSYTPAIGVSGAVSLMAQHGGASDVVGERDNSERRAIFVQSWLVGQATLAYQSCTASFASPPPPPLLLVVAPCVGAAGRQRIPRCGNQPACHTHASPPCQPRMPHTANP